MASMLIFCILHLFMAFTLLCITNAINGPFFKTFNVQSYGALADEKTDNSQAFLKAWSDACRWNGASWVFIPWGTYMLHPVVFLGPCKGPTGVTIKGTLKAPSDPAIFFSDHWISFRYVDQLGVNGDGYLDGQGASAWPYNDCKNNPQCKRLPPTMRFEFVNNSNVQHIKSINSKNVHFNIFGCKNMNISHLRLSCPDDSPNTDGIHLAKSTNIRIENCVIGTGDDCIAMITGTQNVDISNVSCGPGHGISVGSLGKDVNDVVSGINVRNCSFSGTQNGVRIKTWAPSLPGSASNFVFENIAMQNVSNPIIVDQNYCPHASCNVQAQSAVQISNVTLRNIWGTSSSKVAVNIKCSGVAPCKNFKLENINLVSNQPGVQVTSVCSNVNGQSIGTQQPPGCL